MAKKTAPKADKKHLKLVAADDPTATAVAEPVAEETPTATPKAKKPAKEAT